MLVLSRRIGEEIVIGGNVRVTVLNVSGQKVRLGIMAPTSVAVLRQELLVPNPLLDTVTEFSKEQKTHLTTEEMP